MKHLCVDARMLLFSGIGTYLRNLLPRLDQSPFRMRLIVNSEAIQEFPWLTRFDLMISNLKIYSIEEQLKLPLLIPQCDIFWSPHYNVPLFPIKAKHRLVTIHDVNHLALSKHLSLLERLYAKMVLKGAVKRSKKVITVSEFSKKEICSYLKADPRKVEVILHGVDGKVYLPREDGLSAQTKKHFRLPEKFFLYVGNVKPHKNLLGLLKGFLSVVEQLEDVHLLIVGKKSAFIHGDSESEKFADHPKLRDRVRFLGFVEDEYLPSLYRLAIGAVLPSFYEGFGLPAIEAMSSGCPVAVANVSSLPEVCADAAVYFDPHRPEEIGQVLKQLAQRKELLAELKEKGLRRSQGFCWEKTALAHVRVLEELCKE